MNVFLQIWKYTVISFRQTNSSVTIWKNYEHMISEVVHQQCTCNW